MPTATPREAYRDQAIPTKVVDGRWISSSSQPSLMARMLEALGLEPGQRVLEIGTGTGYNAALMAHVVGETGRVTTIDLDEDVTDRARQRLAELGFERVQVVSGDGSHGYPPGAPFDRIILTVGAADIAPAWHEQLVPNGRLLLPLTLIDSHLKLVAFERRNGGLESTWTADCGFIMLRGDAAERPSGELRIRAFPRADDDQPAHRWVIHKPRIRLECEYAQPPSAAVDEPAGPAAPTASMATDLG